MKSRIHLYDHHVGWWSNSCAALPTAKVPMPIFAAGKSAIHALLPDYPRFEIAESFSTPSIAGY
ncbi:hypothetical protein ACNKHO_25805 [Shigella flexneri]